VAPVHSVHQRITPEVVVERLPLNETGEILTERQETICHEGHESESDGPERSDPRPTGRGTKGESAPAVGQTQQRSTVIYQKTLAMIIFAVVVGFSTFAGV